MLESSFYSTERRLAFSFLAIIDCVIATDLATHSKKRLLTDHFPCVGDQNISTFPSDVRAQYRTFGRNQDDWAE